MAGTTSVTVENFSEPFRNAEERVTGKKYTIDWTSDASGVVSGTTILMRGFAMKAKTKGDAVASPTDNWDCKLLDPDFSGIDALQGLLADRDTTTAEEKYLTPSGSATPIYLNGEYEFKIENAGATKQGTVILYVANE